MNDRKNTIAGWILFAGIIGLGSWVVSGETFSSHAPEKPVYGPEDVEEGAGGAEASKPIAFYLATADVAKGEAVFKKCTSCHTANQGGANGLGPNLYGVVGEGIAQGRGGFAFSEALKGKGGTWTFDNLNEWLSSPRKFAPNNKMTFPGLGDPQDRANVIAYLNAQGSNLPFPPPPPEGAAPAPAAGAAPAGNEAAPAGNEAAPAGNEAAPAAAAPKTK